MNTQSDSAAAPTRKPWLSLLIATSGGVGYLPAAPGTWGSLVGVALYFWLAHIPLWEVAASLGPIREVLPSGVMIVVCLVVAIGGVFFATRVSRFYGKKDPQTIVIDEVSGQILTYMLALAVPNWKYLLLGFILFRGFDTWKPFPARQAESLPGGWGIMADDWMAAIYAAIVLWFARGMGL